MSYSLRFDPVVADLNRYLAAQEAEDNRADAVDVRADAIAANPDADQFADVFCGMGAGAGEIEKLRAAWLAGKQAFMAAIMEQMNAGFAALADLEITCEEEDAADAYADALACDAREVLYDWE